eukprot:TRINITY_DN56975_c0_g1_i1.p2 TRINITY_DN56975_c0_g1~~TRINITY_DN56975_c0_g1_i1.p2  ORF type:complete len:116 (+),score=7.37 TRINITY_DN56975_c0_g1_i1:46-393(+)
MAQRRGNTGHGYLPVAEQVRAALCQPGYPESLEQDLQFAADSIHEEVDILRDITAGMDLKDASDRSRLKAYLVLKAMYNLDERKRRQQQEQQNTQISSAPLTVGGFESAPSRTSI